MPGKTFFSHPDCPAVIFDLASGTRIKVKARISWKPQTHDERLQAIRHFLHLGIFIYSDADTYPRKFRRIEKLRPGHEYDPVVTRSLWCWLREFATSRERIYLDDEEGFIGRLLQEAERILVDADYGALPHAPPVLVNAGYLDLHDETAFPGDLSED